MPAEAMTGERDTRPVAELLARGQGRVHMAGIGGFGMAGLARLLQQRGFAVSGCDCSMGGQVPWLNERGIDVGMGHSPDHIDLRTDLVIRSMAVPPDVPELVRAHVLGIPVVLRGTALAALAASGDTIAVSGTHGKTTTAAMLAQVFALNGLAVEYCIGGYVDALEGVAGGIPGARLVLEADESDGTVALYKPECAVVTNIEFDHMEHFCNREEVSDCFRLFLDQTRSYILYCRDDPVATSLCAGCAMAQGYGFHPRAEWRAQGYEDDARGCRFQVFRGTEALGHVVLPVIGRHNALNALPAISLGMMSGLSWQQIISALSHFCAVRRRFQEVGTCRGARVILDYAHHPTEIRAVMHAARRVPHRRIVAVFQPHRYTRTRALGAQFPAAFQGADRVELVPVYSASESPVPGGSARDLMQHFVRQRVCEVHLSESLEKAWHVLGDLLREDDLLLLVGAGDIEKMAEWIR